MPAILLLWVWLCAYLNLAGWTLSALHQLNAGGYVVALALFAAAFWFWKRKSAAEFFPPAWGIKFHHRCRRAFPLAFFLLSALVVLGGLLHAPNNYDGLTYRVPRILNWLAEGQWHWIHTDFPRVNQRACGSEWAATPLVALTGTDRWLFLVNVISLLLLPGLVFSVFTRLGVRRNVAWHWMWIGPAGYCFVLQAGSIGNDLFGAPFALAALDYALRSKKSGSARDLFASVLAAALVTGAKTSNLPLLLPWGIALLPSLKLFLCRPVRLFFVVWLAAAASFLPTALLNVHYCHDWTGWQAESVGVKNAPVLRAISNTVLITEQNLMPPVFPMAKAWNQLLKKSLPAGLSRRLHEIVAEPGAVEFTAWEIQIEEAASLGFGVVGLLGLSVLAARRILLADIFSLSCCLRLAPWVSLAALLSQSEVAPLGRILAPYYLLLIPLLIAGPAQAEIIRRRWWRAVAFMSYFIAAGLLVISPARPLFPRDFLLQKIHALAAQYPACDRIEVVYSVYRDRNDCFAPVCAVLPAEAAVLGVVTYDDPETSLWRPFGGRRILHIRNNDSPADIRARGIRNALVNETTLKDRYQTTFAEWRRQRGAELIREFKLRLRAGRDPEIWFLVRWP